ncbi:globin domain-containing protein [Agaribacterium sp. ZY112]|uniref:globin domain-containing protein n=1 Tax=Agaribacterium sp. ZY112 TaxID=3233574 RepID=UPI0035260736
MSLSAQQVQLIQDSFAKVEAISETAAELFYAQLFEYDPKLKMLFKGNMKDQGKKLMSTLKVAIARLNDLNSLIPVLEKLAAKHVDYGVRACQH